MDLQKVTFPTFVLEPRSMLERITDFMSHPDLLFGQVPFVPSLTDLPCSHPSRSLGLPSTAIPNIRVTATIRIRNYLIYACPPSVPSPQCREL